MYEPFFLPFDAYPGVVPRVRVRGVMALFLAVSILWALTWLLYRAWQVCQTPNEVLVEKLGLDIPPPPEVTLEEITAREIRIAWKQPEFHNSIHKHIIQVNGTKVGESKRAETAVEILNLLPGTIYHICVLSVSAANFQTPSAIIHVRTKPLPASQSQPNAPAGGPTIRASVPRSTAGLPTPSAPMMAREHSGGPMQGKRSSGGRRQSPAASGVDISHGHSDNLQQNTATSDQDENISRLADRLKNLQHENDALEKQATDEEEEHISLLKELEKQRDDLRKRVKEKDEVSGDLKKHVYKLESVNRTVQSEKAKRERLLQQKESDRKKRKNDIVRWQEQVIQMTVDAEQAKEERARLEEEGRKRADEVREKIAKEQSEMKIIDDEIQDKGGRVKKLEDERKKHTEADSEDGKELDRIDHERARQWEIKMTHLNTRYATLVNLHTQAQQQYQEAQERLKWLTSQRAGSTVPFSLPSLDLDMSNTATIRPPRRHRSSLTSNVSSPMNFPSIEPSFPTSLAYNPPSTNSPTFAASTSFFNINNGMTLPGLTSQPETLRRASEFSFNNPQMSPRADALLPSDLLGDEESPELPRPIIRPRFSSLEQSTRRESFPHVPPSPDSSGSRPASLFASPHENQRHSQEADTQALSLGDVEEAPKSASRRLSGLFGFHRPRGKTIAEEPPLLGTLKQGQSQSFPRDLDEIEPIGSRRRRLSYTASWANPMSLLPRNNTTGATADSSSDHLPSRRTAISSIFSPSRFGFGSGNSLAKSSESSDLNTGYNQFSPRHDPIDPSSILGTVRRGSLSPRPSSTFSFDNQLPHPSTDNRHFGWPLADKSGHRSPLGFDWASPSTWSRVQSRRPSTTQYGSSGHLPLGLTGDPDFMDDASFERLGRPLQAPIGTRPSSSHRPLTPKLNPAAPSFKTIFGIKSDKGKDREGEREIDTPFDLAFEDGSPSESRASKDSRSLSNFTRDSYESLERMPSSASTDNASSKESFIRKITRKGSSSKFSSWKDRSGLFSRKGELAQVDIDADGPSETQLAKSVDSTVSSAPSADKSSRSSLGFFSRKPKKSDKAASETSERPSERVSEIGDDEIPEEDST
ncbi:Fibronectin type III domain protein [Aspergillus rambellii]|uniref:Fibronectin type III domain protein n=2 Tax=Aspergillus subgen. Nidulantes TaxID=2720870 RepID=A0A0F8V7G8_9EURO|nr:Fibronectin type III domain protein [Aspergillus ochraceoroseus]KKK18936.1 Fibronectin type III domain protein [Aspergillus rambellii]